MPIPFSLAHHDVDQHPSSASSDQESFADLIGPMLAGAQARGVADALELLGIGAALIDATGQVLHMGARGHRISAGWLRLVERHVVADRSADNLALQTLIGAVIGGTSERPVPVRLDPRPDGARLAIKALPFPHATGAAQLLRAVLVFEAVAPQD